MEGQHFLLYLCLSNKKNLCIYIIMSGKPIQQNLRMSEESEYEFASDETGQYTVRKLICEALPPLCESWGVGAP